jgi:hypothetical protein
MRDADPGTFVERDAAWNNDALRTGGVGPDAPRAAASDTEPS